MVAACAGEELHEIGIRMVADFFEMEGWDVYYTGANIPAKSILDAVKEQKADVVALSITMPSRLTDLRYWSGHSGLMRIQQRLRSLSGDTRLRIIPDLWKRVGADAVATECGGGGCRCQPAHCLNARDDVGKYREETGGFVRPDGHAVHRPEAVVRNADPD